MNVWTYADKDIDMEIMCTYCLNFMMNMHIIKQWSALFLLISITD